MNINWSDASFYGNSENALDVVALQESINNILSTSPGERLFNPKFGCDLERWLFEPCDKSTASMLLVELRACLSSWDPRIQVNIQQTQVTPVPEENMFKIYLVLNVYGVAEPALFQFSLNQMG